MQVITKLLYKSGTDYNRMSVQMSQIGAWFNKVGVVRQYSRPGEKKNNQRGIFVYATMIYLETETFGMFTIAN